MSMGVWGWVSIAVSALIFHAPVVQDRVHRRIAYYVLRKTASIVRSRITSPRFAVCTDATGSFICRFTVDAAVCAWGSSAGIHTDTPALPNVVDGILEKSRLQAHMQGNRMFKIRATDGGSVPENSPLCRNRMCVTHQCVVGVCTSDRSALKIIHAAGHNGMRLPWAHMDLAPISTSPNGADGSLVQHREPLQSTGSSTEYAPHSVNRPCSTMPNGLIRLFWAYRSSWNQHCSPQRTTPQRTTPQHTTLQRTTLQRTTLQHTTPQRTTPQRTTPQRTTPNAQPSNAQPSNAQRPTPQR